MTEIKYILTSIFEASYSKYKNYYNESTIFICYHYINDTTDKDKIDTSIIINKLADIFNDSELLKKLKFITINSSDYDKDLLTININ